MWFDNWSGIGRILVVGAAGYLTLMTILRLSGKRTLAKLNAFDLVVTVALGSTLATILLNSAVSYAEGAAALGLLALLQLIVAWLGSRIPPIRTIVTAKPSYLVRDGVVLDAALARQRVTMTEVHQAVRAAGRGSLSGVAAVVLETDGTLSVIGTDQIGDSGCLADVPPAG